MAPTGPLTALQNHWNVHEHYVGDQVKLKFNKSQ